MIGQNTEDCSGTNVYHGNLDELRIFKRILSADEIQDAWYNGQDNLTSLGDEEQTEGAAPGVTIDFPENTTYTNYSFTLNWSYNETVDWCAYSLESGSNTSFTSELQTTNETLERGSVEYGIGMNGSHMFTSDGVTGRIDVLTSDFTSVENISTSSTARGIAANATHVFVALPTEFDMRIYQHDGTLDKAIDITPNQPMSVAVNTTHAAILTYFGGVEIWNLDGTNASMSWQAEMDDPSGIAMNSTNVYVADDNGTINKYTTDGEYVTSFSRMSGYSNTYDTMYDIGMNNSEFWTMHRLSTTVRHANRHLFELDLLNISITVSEGTPSVSVCCNDSSGDMNCTTRYFTARNDPTVTNLDHIYDCMQNDTSAEFIFQVTDDVEISHTYCEYYAPSGALYNLSEIPDKEPPDDPF
jgi:hypothetical protein